MKMRFVHLYLFIFYFSIWFQGHRSYFVKRSWTRNVINLYTSITIPTNNPRGNQQSIPSRSSTTSSSVSNPRSFSLSTTNSSKTDNSAVVKLFRQAQESIRKNEHFTAKSLLKQCLTIKQQDSHSWLALARLESKTGQIEAAKKTFAQAVQLCPNSFHLFHAWGQLEQKHGNLTLARQCWSEALKIDPLNPYVGHSLATLEIRLGNPGKAKEILNEFVSKKPTGPICISLAEVERSLGNANTAKSILEQALQTCPLADHVAIYLCLAWVVEDAFKQVNLAYDLIERAIKINPLHIPAYIAKANVALRHRNVDLAKRTLYHSLSLHTDQQLKLQHRNLTYLNHNKDAISTDGHHYTMLATIELECGEVETAKRIIEEGAKLYPNDHFLLQRWGSIEAKHGNISLARLLFARSIKMKPHAPTYVAWALLELSQVNRFANEKMQTTYNIYLTKSNIVNSSSSSSNLNSNSFSSATTTSTSDHYKSMINKVRQLFQLGMKADPLHAPLYHAYANMELRLGNTTAAKEIFMKGIEQNCLEISCLYHGLGQVEEKLEQYDNAKKTYYTGIKKSFLQQNYNKREIDTSVMYLFHSLGMLEYKSKQYNASLTLFNTGLTIFNNNSQLYLGLALVYSKLNNIDLSRYYFQQSITSDPYHVHAWQSWAVIEKQYNNYDKARYLFKKGLQYGQNHGPLWQAYAVMEMELGNNEIARVLFQEAIQRSSYHAPSYQAWAYLEVKLGNYYRAKELVEAGLQKCPSHPALWSIATIVEEKLGNIDQAKKIGYSGILLFPRHGPLFRILGELESRQGNKGKARELFWKGIQMDPKYSSTYHVAALFEAKNGNLVKLGELHAMAKELFSRQRDELLINSEKAEKDYDIFRKIHELQNAETKSQLEDLVERQSTSEISIALNELNE